MQEIIERILEGNFDYENSSLDFSCTKLELTLTQGTIYEGSFHILSAPGSYVTGRVFSSDLRMECLTDTFTGDCAEIFYCFHGEKLEQGDVIQGAFSIVSNRGEYTLPFVATVEHTIITSSLGVIRNLFHFTNLAKSNWQEAVRLFYAPEFAKVFQGSDAHFYNIYKALSANSGNEQNLEEFLIQINKKQQVEFLVEERELSLELARTEGPYAVTEACLDIVRNGWGYTNLQVECQGDFIFTEKETLSDDDFLGNRCKLPVYVDSSACRPGRNFGRIYVYNAYLSIEIPVTVKIGDGTPVRHADWKRKQYTVQLMKLYQDFRLKKIGTSVWLSETGRLVEKLVVMDEEDTSARLFQAQVLITEERYNEAGWILDHVAELLEEDKKTTGELWAYYLYLTTLIHREEAYVRQVADQVEQIYRRDRTRWRVAWLLLYLSEEYNRSVTGKWLFLEKQFQYGCTSPILYIEALYLINNNPALLRKLDAFEQQVLLFGARQEALGDGCVEQLLYLSGRTKEYMPVLRRTLELLYRKKQDVRILQEICSLLIKGGRTGQDCLAWYQKGVDSHLRITNLYEYYMMSIDPDSVVELPRVVLMYFSYQSNLDYEHSAFLYDYLLKHREEYPELYGQYLPRMEHFVVEQIKKEHISRHLAGLYQELLTPALITAQLAKPLSRLLFAHLIRVEDDRLRKVLVYQPGRMTPDEYYLQNGVTWAAIYGNEYTIVFEDAWGNLYLKNAEYTLEKLMMPGKLLMLLQPYAPESVGLDLYLAGMDRKEELPSPDSLARLARIAADPAVEPEVRRKTAVRLLQYYYDADDRKALDDYLEQFPDEDLSREERAGVVRFMVLRGNYRKAYQWIAKYSPYFVDAKILLRLTDALIRQSANGEDPVLLAAAMYAFRKGKYNGELLIYLAQNYQGTTRELRDIWKAARAFDLDCYELSERILVQMLFSGAFVGEKLDILRYYVSQGAKQEVEEAVLVQYSYEYFVKDKLTEEYVLRQIRHCFLRGENTQCICKLAYLKYYAENQALVGEDDKPLISSFLKEMMDNRIHLNFFREYKEYAAILQEMWDKSIVEYRTHPGARVRIHYVLLHENGEAEDYMTEYMREVYSGFFFKEFVLFFGESLQYYIMEEADGEEQLTESGSLQKSDIVNDAANSKYDMINDMMISMTLQDYDTLDKLLEEYFRKEFLNDAMFKLQ